MFKKLFLLIFSCLIIISCGGKNYKVETYKNQIPKWYVVDKVDENKVFGKALGESTSLELANREAEALAVSNVIFKIKQEMSAIKNQYLSKKFSQKGKIKLVQHKAIMKKKLNLQSQNMKSHPIESQTKAFIKIQMDLKYL